MERNPPCPHCGGHASRNGSLKELKAACQKYFCTACERSFSTFTRTLFFEGKKPPRIVAFGVELVKQFGLSLRQAGKAVEDFWKCRVSHSTIGNWCKGFADRVSELALAAQAFDSEWHVDEMFIRHEQRLPSGKRVWFDYLFVVSDSKQRVIAMHLSKTRDTKAAKTVLAKAKERAGFTPRLLVSDGLAGYQRACRQAFGRKTLHVTAHFQPEQFILAGEAYSLSNNSAEGLNSRLRNVIRKLRGWKAFKHGERFIHCLQTVWNSRWRESLARALLNTINA